MTETESSNTLAIEAKLKAKEAAAAAGKKENDEDDDTPTSRFNSRMLKWLSQGFVAKNKVVRFRCIHVVSEMISHLGEMEQVYLPLSSCGQLTHVCVQ